MTHATPEVIAAMLRRLEAERDAKAAMLAAMAHEIRNPLAAILGMAELLEETCVSADQREMVRTISHGALGLRDVVNNVLDLSKLEAGKVELAPQAFALMDVVEESLELVAAQAGAKQIELASSVAANLPDMVLGDPLRVRQVLLNLLSNAVKFTDQGEVLLAVTETNVAGEGLELEFSVRDTGVGIPPERLETVFEDFAQGDASTARRFGGTGLGLSISRQLVALMGGRMWAESAAGEGAAIRFTIKVGRIVNRPPADPVSPVFGASVLIVDDHDAGRRMLHDLLARWGVRVHSTASPREALSWLDQGHRYDVVLVEEHMVEMDGRALVRQINRRPDTRHVPVILLTSLRSSVVNGTAASLVSGARIQGYLNKPLRRAQVQDVLVAALASRNRRGRGGGSTTAIDVDAIIAAGTGAGPGGTTHPTADRQLAGARIVIADDDRGMREALERRMVAEGGEVIAVEDGQAALEVIASDDIDLVLLDGNMPRVNGFEACRRIKDDPKTMLIPVVIITGLGGGSDAVRIRGMEAGADGFLPKPYNSSELIVRVRSLVRTKRFTDRLEQAEGVLVAMARCIEGRDPYTYGHCERLSDYGTRLARRLGLSEDDTDALRLAGIVHDIGKVAVPDAILQKPGALTETEWRVMRSHPVEGEKICSGLASFRNVLPIIRHHHERCDGTGYPDGLRREEIPVTARVLAIVDVYDALTTERPYKHALSPTEALAEMRVEVNRGWWDPEIFDQFERVILDEVKAERDESLAFAS